MDDKDKMIKALAAKLAWSLARVHNQLATSEQVKDGFDLVGQARKMIGDPDGK